MKIKKKDEPIFDFLKNEPVKNVNMIRFAEKNGYSFIARIGNSVLMRGASDREWVFISSSSREEALELLKLLTGNDKNFAVIENWLLPLIAAEKQIKWAFETVRVFYPGKIPFADIDHREFIPISIQQAEYLFNNSDFSEYSPVPYIEQCLKNGPSAGIKEGERLAGWALTHDDGAMGFLHVIEEFRRRGIAEKIMKYLVNTILESGNLPFAHIEKKNFPSMNLAMKLGFKKDREATWFEIE